MKKQTTNDSFVGIVLLDDYNRIYLIKEEDKNKIGKGRWNLPGGSIDGNESLVMAAKRETKEETGYEAKINSLIGCYRCKKGDTSWIYTVFDASVVKNSKSATDPDVKEGRWFEGDEFIHLDAEEIVHPDMHLVYNIAIEGKGLSLDSIKFIDYDIQ